MPETKKKVGLVLGAGGVMGGAWHTGALHALATETGWDPGSADYIVGTSAGSLRMALTTLANPLRHTPLQVMVGWAPVGLVSTDSLKETVRRAVQSGWV